MADLYVSSVDGSDADNGTTWALAKATVTGALAIAVNGDCIYVDSAHAYTATAAITWNAASGATVRIISVDRNGSTTTGHNGWLAGASESVGAANSAITVGNAAVDQTLFLYGLTLAGGTRNNAASDVSLGTASNQRCNLTCVSCTFSVPTANSGGSVVIGPSTISAGARGNNVVLTNCAFALANSASATGIAVQNTFLQITNPTISFSGANKPAKLFAFSNTGFSLLIRDGDLSGYDASGGAYFDVAGITSGDVVVTNCKLSATPSLVTGTFPRNIGSITLVNTDSGDTKNVFEYRNRLGTLTESTSVYADSGGQFDGSGISWQIVTTASCDEWEPFVTPWLHRWSGDTAEITAGLEIVHDSATDLTDRTAWPEFEYLGNASFPLGTLASGRFATPFEGTAADWANSSDAWTGTGGFANANKQTLAATFTPAEKSLLRARLNVGVASKTLYLDPALRITGYDANPAVRWTRDGAINAEPSGGGGGSIFSSPVIH